MKLDMSTIKQDKSLITNNIAHEKGHYKNNKLYMEGVIVLVQGFIATSKTTFHVYNILSPPNEEREISKNAIGKNIFNELWVHGTKPTTSQYQHVFPISSSHSSHSPGSPGSHGSPGGSSSGSSSPMAKHKQFNDVLLTSMVRPQYWDNLLKSEENQNAQSIIFLSDIQLDRPHVLEKLQLLFQTYESMYTTAIHTYIQEMTESDSESDINIPLPPMFVIMGPFVSQPDLLSQSGREVTNSSFESFGQLLIKYCPILLCNSKFVFVPSPHDVGTGNSLPNFPLSSILLEHFHKMLNQFIVENSNTHYHDRGRQAGYGYDTHISNSINNHINTVTNQANNLIFTTNPSRIHYYTQEIVIFRDDLMQKVQKHAIFCEEPGQSVPHAGPNINMSKEQLVVESILDQGHLCPLMTSSSGAGAGSIPIYWDMDDAMRLFPLPTLVCI